MKGLPRSNSRGAPQRQEIIKQVIRVKDVLVTVDGATGVGFGSAVIGDLPEGNILFLGAAAYIEVDATGQANVIANWNGDYGVGTTPADDGTITNADVDIIASSVLDAGAADKIAPRARGVNATQAILDNTDGSLELNLNILIDDASIDADDQVLTCNGELHLAYIVLGDD